MSEPEAFCANLWAIFKHIAATPGPLLPNFPPSNNSATRVPDSPLTTIQSSPQTRQLKGCCVHECLSETSVKQGLQLYQTVKTKKQQVNDCKLFPNKFDHTRHRQTGKVKGAKNQTKQVYTHTIVLCQRKYLHFPKKATLPSRN